MQIQESCLALICYSYSIQLHLKNTKGCGWKLWEQFCLGYLQQMCPQGLEWPSAIKILFPKPWATKHARLKRN